MAVYILVIPRKMDTGTEVSDSTFLDFVIAKPNIIFNQKKIK